MDGGTMTTTTEMVVGRLTDNAGTNFPVGLRLTVERFPSSDEVPPVSTCKLVFGEVPDGTYVVEYFYFKWYREPVRVQFGVLVSPLEPSNFRSTDFSTTAKDR
jgi:hypothetical protein